MLKSSFFAGTAALALLATAQADTPAGTYVGLAAGANWLEDYDFFAGKQLDSDTGYYVGGLIGYKWTGGIRAEFEASYRDNTWTRQTFDSFDHRALSGMINVLYDLDVGEGMALSLGAGIGASRVSNYYDDNSPNSRRDVVFAYQGIAEFEAMVGDQVGIYAGYNYFVADNWDFDGYNGDYVSHTVKLGVKFHFQEAPETAVAPPPPPPPHTGPQAFIVFFNFDKTDLTPEGQAVVAEAAAYFAKTGNAVVSVIAHTDTVGTASYNLALSQRRADTVKTALMAGGVPDGAITAQGRGFSEPLVVTGPNVREPQNRRATIDFSPAGS